MDVDPYVHAALLLKGLGKDITKDNITAVLKSVGGEVDEAKAKVLEDALKDVNWDEALKAPTITAVSAPAAGPTPAADDSKAKKEEASKEEEKQKEEEAAAGLANLFG